MAANAPTTNPASSEVDLGAPFDDPILFDDPVPDLDLETIDVAETRVPRSLRPDSPPSSDDSIETITQVAMEDWRYNIPSAERRLLTRRLKDLLQPWPQPIEFWACLQVCEIIKLGWIVELAATCDGVFDNISFGFCDFPKNWINRWNSRTTVTNHQALSDVEAARKRARQATRERDGGRCVLTGTRTNVKILELCPPNLADNETQSGAEPKLWPSLSMLWLNETITRWRAALFPYRNKSIQVQSSSNMICLRADLCEKYKQGLFAFHLLWASNDNKTMELEFHWLPKEPLFQTSLRPIQDLPIPTKGLDNSQGVTITIQGRDGPENIKTGHKVFLRTPDPVDHPLPGPDLVALAWNMTRIVGMTGAGEGLVVEGDDSDGDGGGGWMEEVDVEEGSSEHIELLEEVEGEEEGAEEAMDFDLRGFDRRW